MKERPREWTEETALPLKDIIYEKKYFDNGGVARITINNPTKRNAIPLNGIYEIFRALRDANWDKSIGVVVITGAGDQSFCAGADLSGTSGEEFEWFYTSPDAPAEQFYLRQLTKPSIAAVKGWAVGFGNHLAYNCDFTIAADNAKFMQTEGRGVSPINGPIASYMAMIVGPKRAKEVWMLCRSYSAQQALEWGLINAVVPLDKMDEEVDRWCEELLDKSPTVLQLIKESFDRLYDDIRGNMSFIQMQAAPRFFGSEEREECLGAFLEKRKPKLGKFRDMPEQK